MIRLFVVWLVLAATLFVSLGSDTAHAAKASEKWTDPHAYCRAVGTIDAPDSRYAGLKEPHGIRDLFDDLSDRTDVILEWRCMDGAVYACGSGNSPICDKMTPYDNLEEIKKFCRESPNESPPAVITGRFPVNWVCKGGTPYIEDGDLRVDRRGFPTEYWKWWPTPYEPGR
jgi:hypothetical protein